MTAEHVFDITNLADTEDYVVYGHTPLLNLQPVDVNKELDIYAALQKARRTKVETFFHRKKYIWVIIGIDLSTSAAFYWV